MLWSDTTAIVTVVFEPEIPLLDLQARSFARYLAAEFSEVVVIDNTARGLSQTRRRSLLESYGRLGPAVRFVRPAQITQLPLTVGWRGQQVLKLVVARQIDSRYLLVLDAKNHLVRGLTPADLASPDGRPRARVHSFENHRLRPDLEHVLKFAGLSVATNVKRFTTTVTPFVMERNQVLTMLQEIETLSGEDFATAFVRNDLTEFFIYTAWLLRAGLELDDAFCVDSLGSPTVWPRAATSAGVRAAIAESETSASPFFAVHRRALIALPPEARNQLYRFWTEHDLLEDIGQAETMIDSFARDYKRLMRQQRIKDLPGKAALLPRRLRQRLGLQGGAQR